MVISSKSIERKNMVHLEDLKKDQFHFTFKEMVKPAVFESYPYDITYHFKKLENGITESKVVFPEPIEPSVGYNMDIPGYVLTCMHAAMAHVRGYSHWVSGTAKSDTSHEFKGKKEIVLYFSPLSSEVVPPDLGGNDYEWADGGAEATIKSEFCNNLLNIQH